MERDFLGASGLFSFTFKKSYSADQIAKFINSLDMFGLGFSWGGYKSLLTARPYKRDGQWLHDGKHLIRLSIGLEETKDLIEDLEQAFNNL